MDGTTLVQAIADVRGYIDDSEGRRWDRDQCKRAIHSALSGAMELYGRTGGDRFDVEGSFSAVGADGVSLITENPIAIRQVLIADGADGWTWAVRAADPAVRGVADTSTRTLTIRYMPSPLMPEHDDDVLCGLIPGVQRPWPAFERWVCMRAARELGIKDKDERSELHAAEAKLEAECLAMERTPRALPWSSGRPGRFGDLRWLWLHQTATLKIVSVMR